jgi:hypothetical protein
VARTDGPDNHLTPRLAASTLVQQLDSAFQRTFRALVKFQHVGTSCPAEKPLQQLKRIHVDEEGKRRDLFGIGVSQRGREEFG